jgi:hypothetical protein
MLSPLLRVSIALFGVSPIAGPRYVHTHAMSRLHSFYHSQWDENGYLLYKKC